MVKYHRIRRALANSRLRIPLVWYRHRKVRPADAALASYRRSGSTWLSFLLYEVLSGEEAQFERITRHVSTLRRVPWARPLLPGGGRVFRTHEPFRREYKKAVYIVRDVRDVVVSDCKFLKYAGLSEHDLETYIPGFIRGAFAGFGDWRSQVESWLHCGLEPGRELLWLRYEDLKADPVSNLLRIAQFLKVDVTEERVRCAVENNTLEKMRKKEDQAPPEVLPPNKGQGAGFVRKGKAGGWREVLTPVQVEVLEDYAGDLLQKLGYTVNSPRT